MKWVTIGAVAVLAVAILSGCFFVLPEWQQAVVIQLGSPVGAPITEAGLHVKVPLLQKVVRFEKRILEWDGDPEVVPTKDSKFIFVDTFARWRITDALKFYKRLGSEADAQSKLDDVLDGLVRDVLSAHTLLEVVRSSNRPLELGEEALGTGEGAEETEDTEVLGTKGLRGELTREITEKARQKLKELDLGIDVVNLQIKRLDYTEKVEHKVYERMISQQLRIAEKYRALGQGKKAEIAGQVTEESKRIRSEAYRKAQEIIGDGEAEAARIYAQAYSKDPEFYKFVETLRTYEECLDKRGVLFITTDSELYRYLKRLR